MPKSLAKAMNFVEKTLTGDAVWAIAEKGMAGGEQAPGGEGGAGQRYRAAGVGLGALGSPSMAPGLHTLNAYITEQKVLKQSMWKSH